MNKCNWLYRTTAFMAVLACTLTFVNKAVLPLRIASYAKFSPNGKVIIDKDLLENIQHPPVVEFSLWVMESSGLAEWLLPLTVESIADAARSRSGLGLNAEFWYDREEGEAGPTGPKHLPDSYAHTYWYVHLRELLQASEVEGKPYLSAFGRFMMRDTCIEALKSQLEIVALWNQHGEELSKEQITRPIVISGPPRSMTTHAQSILANHPDVHFLRFSEGRDPLLPKDLPADQIYSLQDPRHKILSLAKRLVSYLRPFFYYMFRFDADNMGNTPQEDIFLQAQVFGSPQFETNTYIPSYSQLWHSHTNRPSYRFLKMTQQVMQWQRRQVFGKGEEGKRWLMKTPEHVGFCRDLMAVYPDAVWVLTHRDPVPVVQSFIPMILYIQGLFNRRIDAQVFAEYQLVALEKRLTHLVEQIDSVPASQVIHVPFQGFVRNNLEWTQKICNFVGLRWDEQTSKVSTIFH
ncbi:hypothetical protein BASA81_015601 [Batrachochytrium salamandrivorans]|nr:hypothetical protein BASA81_015601 [Batrachochytrium salamandrivorans]